MNELFLAFLLIFMKFSILKNLNNEFDYQLQRKVEPFIIILKTDNISK